MVPLDMSEYMDTSSYHANKITFYVYSVVTACPLNDNHLITTVSSQKRAFSAVDMAQNGEGTYFRICVIHLNVIL